MSTWRQMITAALVATVVAGGAVPAVAQFSDSYKFIKAVKDKDGNAAQKILNAPGGNTIVNVRDGGSGETALHIVVRRGDLSWLGFLLQRGANPNLVDRDGSSPLLLAATNRFEEAVRILLTVQAQPDLANRLGETPLIKAVQLRDAGSVQLLLTAGANPDRPDNTGGTARSYAAGDPRAASIARLLKDLKPRKSAPMQGPSL